MTMVLPRTSPKLRGSYTSGTRESGYTLGMMYRTTCALVLGLLAAGVATGAAGEKIVGVAPSLTTRIPIADVVAKPSVYEGKTVRLDGVVTAVCQEMGCWMALAAENNPKGPTVRFKVEDGVIVFPVSARGHRASAQGVVERIKTGDRHSRAAAEEHAHEDGRTPPSAAAELWQIRATGAVIY
jgi:hypothetical protein